jgi:mRNA interferase RelE/StbE
LTKSSFEIVWTTPVKKELAALERQTQKRIIAAVELLRLNPLPSKAIRLVAPEPKYRIRVGDYRVVYQIENQKLYILVVAVGHRKDVYRKHL